MKRARSRRAGVQSRLSRSADGIWQARGEFGMSMDFYSYLTPLDLEEMPEKTVKMLRNGNGVVRKCAKCQWISVMAKKTWLTWGQMVSKKHGEYWCKYCHMGGTWKRHPNSLKRQPIYKKAYENAVKVKMRSDGVSGRTYVRQLTAEEREMYGLPLP